MFSTLNLLVTLGLKIVLLEEREPKKLSCLADLRHGARSLLGKRSYFSHNVFLLGIP